MAEATSFPKVAHAQSEGCVEGKSLESLWGDEFWNTDFTSPDYIGVLETQTLL